MRTNFVTLDPPEARVPQRIVADSNTHGQRVVLLLKTGYMRDVRAVGDPTVGDDGRLYIRVCAEVDWFRWRLNNEVAKTENYPAYLVFLE